MTGSRPRHSRKEIRAFADWLAKEGWTYTSTDSKGHTIWTHPKASGPYKLPETPKRFSVQGARRDVFRLLGRKVEGKRRPKAEHAPRPKQRASTPGSPQQPKITASAARALEASERRRRFYTNLMQPEVSRR